MTLSDIQLAVCAEFKMTLSQMVSRSRKRIWAWPRHVAMGLCRDMTDKTLYQIARAFKRSDHTTILHGVENYRRLLEEEEWALRIYKIEKELR